MQTITTRPHGLIREAADTLRLGLPLAGALLAQMSMGIVDTIMLGGLGPDALAVGGLAGSVEIAVLVVLQGVVASVSVLVAQARGAGQDARIPRLYWTALLLTLLFMVPAFLLFALAEPGLRLAGQPPGLAHDVGAFLHVLRWCIPGALIGFGLLRAFLPAIGAGWLLLPVTLAGVALNTLLCYALIRGAWGAPALGMTGVAMATVITNTLIAATLLLLVHASAARRPFVRRTAPGLDLLAALLRLGLPIGATYAVEAGLFFSVALLIGTLGTAPLAAHQITLITVSAAFMIPLGLAQAANVRVGHAVGARDPAAARRAGLVAIALGALFELACALAELIAPGQIVAFYIDPADVETTAMAIALLHVAVLFQVADGAQCVAAGALRGLGDTRIPFALAALGYWGIGFPLAWLLSRPERWGAPGAWFGLAAGLVAVAILLSLRFARRSARPIAG